MGRQVVSYRFLCIALCINFNSLLGANLFILVSNELLQYKDKHGNCDVAVRKGFEEYKQLANWAGLQRRKWKAKQNGTTAGRTTSITDVQVKKLASIGFPFSLQVGTITPSPFFKRLKADNSLSSRMILTNVSKALLLSRKNTDTQKSLFFTRVTTTLGDGRSAGVMVSAMVNLLWMMKRRHD